jgi:hypothetical protein
VRSGIGDRLDGSFEMKGAAQTLEIPKEPDLRKVETIDIDRS